MTFLIKLKGRLGRAVRGNSPLLQPVAINDSDSSFAAGCMRNLLICGFTKMLLRSDAFHTASSRDRQPFANCAPI